MVVVILFKVFIANREIIIEHVITEREWVVPQNHPIVQRQFWEPGAQARPHFEGHDNIFPDAVGNNEHLQRGERVQEDRDIRIRHPFKVHAAQHQLFDEGEFRLRDGEAADEIEPDAPVEVPRVDDEVAEARGRKSGEEWAAIRKALHGAVRLRSGGTDCSGHGWDTHALEGKLGGRGKEQGIKAPIDNEVMEMVFDGKGLEGLCISQRYSSKMCMLQLVSEEHLEGDVSGWQGKPVGLPVRGDIVVVEENATDEGKYLPGQCTENEGPCPLVTIVNPGSSGAGRGEIQVEGDGAALGALQDPLDYVGVFDIGLVDAYAEPKRRICYGNMMPVATGGGDANCFGRVEVL
ncbi:hypothetical protein B0H11DRAFT_2197210 [Mycena galericulata]|nr:hypothetical protein B0H11DRAFT_2197210 [Mycena galericulata]